MKKHILNKELLIKAIVWRLSISIPSSLAITYFFLGSLGSSFILTLTLNVIGTMLQYWFELEWPTVWKKLLRIQHFEVDSDV